MAGRRIAFIAVCMLLLTNVNGEVDELNHWRTLVGSETEAYDRFGHSLEVDDEWMLVGAPGEEHGGEAYFYKLAGGEWTESQRVSADVTNFADFGHDVAIAGDWAAIGAPYDGHVHMYRLQGGAWIHATTLSGNDERYGWSVAMDGNYLLVGAPGRDSFSPLAEAGQVYLYERSGSSWVERDTVSRGGLGSNGQFGYDVDIDGVRTIIGSPSRYFEEEVQPGSIWFFDIVSDKFAERGEYGASFGFDEYGQFGGSVAIDGNNAMVTDDINAAYTPIDYGGDLFAYERRGGEWVEIFSDFYYGQSIDIDGNIAVVGSWAWDDAIIMERTATSWAIVDSVYGGCCDDFGFDVALDGGVLFVGAPREDTEQEDNTGAVHIFIQGIPPIAVAGDDVDLIDWYQEGFVTATLDGSLSTDEDGHIVSYEWHEGGDIIATGQVATASLDVGRHRIDLWVQDDDGLRDRDRIIIDVLEGPDAEADFRWSPSRPHVGDLVQFEDLSTHPTATLMRWDWDFDGDGASDSTAQHPRHIFSSSATREITLTVGASDGDVLAKSKTPWIRDMHPIAEAGPDIVAEDTDDDKVESVTLDASNSQDPDGTIERYTWTSDGKTLASGAVVDVELATGWHNIDLSVQDDAGNRDVDGLVVLVAPGGSDAANATKYRPDGPSALFSWQHTQDTHPHRVVEFKDASADPETEVIMWLWSFGDGQQSTDQSPRHSYLGYGDYPVQLSVTDSDGNTGQFEDTITINNEPPTVDFVPRQLYAVPLGEPVVFFDQSTDPEDALVAWQWDFGDGTTSQRQDVGHIFYQEAVFNVTLTVTDDGGEQATTNATIQIGESWGNETEEIWDQTNATQALQNGTVLTDEGPQDLDEYLEELENPKDDEADGKTPTERLSNSIDSLQEKLPFPWWILLILLAVGVLIIVAVAKRKKR